MAQFDIARLRLENQCISRSTFTDPAAVVQWLGAVQAQDYAAAKWALGLRLPGSTDDSIEQALTAGTILRTHVMRPTWHFVLPADIRWLLALTAPRVKAAMAYGNRQSELDEALFRQSNAVLTKALQGGKQLTRPELVAALQQAGIATNDLRFVHIMMRAELDGIVCSGARQGKQFTYALLDERAPQVRPFEREEALAELVTRYFASHGPATLADFVWWSGLTMTDARAGLALASCRLHCEVIDDQSYWCASFSPPAPDFAQAAYLLPNYDEYIVGYTDRRAVFDASHTNHLDSRGNVLFNHTLVLDGRIVGTWKRTLKKERVIFTPNFFTPLDAPATSAFAAVAERYGAFLSLAVSDI